MKGFRVQHAHLMPVYYITKCSRLTGASAKKNTLDFLINSNKWVMVSNICTVYFLMRIFVGSVYCCGAIGHFSLILSFTVKSVQKYTFSLL